MSEALPERNGAPTPSEPPTQEGLRAWAERLWRTVRELEARANAQAAEINELRARVAELEG